MHIQSQPSYQPPQGPRRPRFRQHRILAIAGGVLGVLLVIGGTTDAMGAVRVAASPVKAAPSCKAQAKTWVEGGAARRLNALDSGLKHFSHASQQFAHAMAGSGATGKDVSAVRSAAASLKSAAKAVESKPGPACIAGLRPNLKAAGADFVNGAVDADNAMKQYTAKHQVAAAGDIKKASGQLTAGNKKVNAALAALNRFAQQ